MSTSQTNKGRQILGDLVSRKVAIPLEILLVISAAVGLAISSPNATVWTVGIWVVLATGYVLVAVRRLMKAVTSPESNRALLPGESPDRYTRPKQFVLDFSLIGIASAMGLVSAIMLSLGETEGVYALAAQVLAPIAIFLSWILMQLGFARLYANTWFREADGGGLKFWETEDPGLIEFTHYAFSPGSAYVTNSRMRMLATAHTIISLLYRTILFAYAVSMIPTG